MSLAKPQRAPRSDGIVARFPLALLAFLARGDLVAAGVTALSGDEWAALGDWVFLT